MHLFHFCTCFSASYCILIISDNSTSMLAVKNWSEALDPTYGLPPDVAFNIIEEDGGDEYSGKDTIAAHKYFLAMASPVFKAMFFGLTKETREVVPLRGTSKDAFTLMIHYIYEKKICWMEKGVFLLLEVVNLAEMYDLEGLIEEVKKPLAKYPLTPETVIPVASAAEMFSQFEEISSRMFSLCATFLATKVLTTKAATYQFASS
jgi:hypothetical protein